METDPKLLEKEAYAFLAQEKPEEAYRLFKKAADIYRREGNHKESALCFASAASCWGKKCGEKTFYESASLYEEAARCAKEYLDFEYSSLLYKYAAISYERDGEFLNFSDCFYHSKETYRKFLAYSLFKSKKIHHIIKGQSTKGIKGKIKVIFLWFLMTFSYLIWGHGERPARTFYTAIMLILLSSFIYAWGDLFKNGSIFKPDFLESLYLSVMTFTTVGYGDVTPVGLNRLVAMCEAFSGMFIVPLFMIGLSRKYLRV